MILALVIGTVLAVGALVYVLAPLFMAPRAAAPVGPSPHAPRDLAIVALREIEFDRATGKLSQSDYDALRARYVAPALEELRAAGVAAPDGADDPIEAALRAYRATHAACPSCGPRPEPDARYCSDCGRYLAGRCAGCGASVESAGARFCPECGLSLAA